MRFIRPCTSQSLGKRLVESLVVPHLYHCNIEYADASLQFRTQLQILANAAIRYTFGLRRDERISQYRKKFNWLTNNLRRDYFAMLLMYRVVRMNQPPFLLPLLKKFISDRPTRGPWKDLDTPKVSTNFGLLSFQVKHVNLWNLIPPCIRYLPSFTQFKKSIKIHLMKMEQ